MRRFLSSLSVNQRLAGLAFLLGAVAIFARPVPGGTVTIDARELALIVQREADHVAPLDLADWIVKERADYRLVDLRDPKAYAEYHIPGAENITVAALPDAPLERNETIVLYSDGGIHAAQAWFLMKARGYRGVYTLLGGLEGWRDEVLFPTLADHPTPFQAERNARLAALAARFGGQARSGQGGEGAAPALIPTPLPSMPSAPSGTPVPAVRKKKKEGC